jgi:gas vesicle protein
MRLLLLLLAVTASATEAPGPCVKKTKKSFAEPATLGALMSCQKKKLSEASAAYKAKKGTDASEALVEQWQERQLGEAHEYLNRHPDRAPAEKAAEKGTAKTEETGDSKISDKDMDALGRELKEMSNGGKNGITPEMAQKVNDYLMKNQGSVSPEMQKLLDATQKDGANLTKDTVDQLKDASQKAKGEGLELGVDKKTEDFLLQPKEPAGN